MFKYIKRSPHQRDEKTVIAVGGMIGSGKSTVTNLVAEKLNFKPYYEEVNDNETLKLFYTASSAEKEKFRYPFLLQLEFLSSRFETIKEALRRGEDAIIDRSIYEDWYFAYINTKIGDISEQEFKIYEKLLNNMMEELDELPKKSPDLMIYLKISFEESLRRIGMRGRDFEQDKELYDYYYELWQGYDEWLQQKYKHSSILVIDMDKVDFDKNPQQIELFTKELTKYI